ncbi:hypothetical protein [Abyssisolibacter fermentans]|uniref:hypothetical protein n=1 Tax=Abyssisolibacter fermentans TaxID=1766203 RepID=UPI00082AC943|nr:hypothetical protein [Abyssisolibacter fermentans]
MESKIFNITKKTVIVFFALVFILGVFSKSVTDLFLPKVCTAIPLKSTFPKTLNIEGKVVPKEIVKVRLAGNVIVEEYYVKAGDEVKKGDPLFKINKNYGVKSANKNIDELKLDIEKEKSKLNKLQDTSYEIDEKNISLLETNIKNMKEKIKKLEELYNAGAVTASKLEDNKQSLKEAEANFEIEKLLLDEKREEKSIDIKDTLNNIEKLKKEINDIENINSFYSQVADDGIYYSEADGIVLTINKTDIMLYKDVILIEVGVVKGYDSVKFVAQVPEEYYYFVNRVSTLNVETEKKNVYNRVKITNVNKIANENIVEVEGDFSESVDGYPVINKKIKGIVEKNYTRLWTVPKVAVVPFDKYELGAPGYVYVVLAEEGVLGTEYVVSRVQVTMAEIGDNSISLDENDLSRFTNPKVITNISYKIRSGMKVKMWK